MGSTAAGGIPLLPPALEPGYEQCVRLRVEGPIHRDLVLLVGDVHRRGTLGKPVLIDVLNFVTAWFGQGLGVPLGKSGVSTWAENAECTCGHDDLLSREVSCCYWSVVTNGVSSQH